MKLKYPPPILSAATLLAGALFAFAGTEGPEAGPPRAASGSAEGCGSSVFLVWEQGKLAAVDWVQYARDQVHTRVVETQSHIIEATIHLRPDATAAHSVALISTAGEEGEPMKSEHDLGEGAIYWSPRMPSSIEQAIQRARVLNVPAAKIPGASLFSGARPAISVQRVDPTSWALTYQDKKYLALSDSRGCLLSATMPDYGVTIERRDDFPVSQYPLWPPYAAPPDGTYRAEKVSIRAPQGHSLAGTITVPPHKGPGPAAVLITGLSPHERNNGDAPWMPFRDIADALTRAGFVVLRVDDRGVGKSTGEKASFTIFDKADDVRAEVAWLRSQSMIDPKRIMLVGYSEGGLIAPMVASTDAAIAAVVTLAGPGVPGMEVARYQVLQPILKDPEITAANREKEFEKQLAEALKDLSPHETTFLKADPIQYDQQVRCPALVLQGGADVTVPVRSAEAIAHAMRAGGNSDVTVRIFPGVSHFLLPDPEGLPSGMGALPAFVTAPDLLEELTRWSVTKLRPGY